MMRLILLCLFAGPALAQEFPVLADVAGVTAGDVLNIRETPDAGGAIVGSLAPDATGVEVLGVEGGWARVNSGEGAGYAALRFLALRDGEAWYGLNQPLACSGTEPFWSLDIDPAAGATAFRTPETPEPLVSSLDEVWLGAPWAQSLAVELPMGLAVMYPKECSDGMSDRAFGIAIDIFLSDPAGARYAGCCSLEVR